MKISEQAVDTLCLLPASSKGWENFGSSQPHGAAIKLSLPASLRLTTAPTPHVAQPRGQDLRVQPKPPLITPTDIPTEARKRSLARSRGTREDLIPGSGVEFAIKTPFELPVLLSAKRKPTRGEQLLAELRGVRRDDHGFGDEEEARAILRELQASPVGYFSGRDRGLRGVGTYIGISSFLRSEALEGRVKWGRAGWEEPQSGFDVHVAALRRWMEDSNVTFAEFLPTLLRGQEDWLKWPGYGYKTSDAERAYQAMGFAGEASHALSGVEDREFTWGEVRELALAMRLISVEQVNLMLPSLSLRRVREVVQDWVDKDYLKPQDSLGKTGLALYRLTATAVEEGVHAGIMSAVEAKSRLTIRSTQEAHDLAVGDAIILAAMDVHGRGGQVLDLQTETSFSMAGHPGPWPDFCLAYQIGNRQHESAVEVIGLGGNYRSTAKIASVKAAGFKLFNPGFDGMGARYV